MTIFKSLKYSCLRICNIDNTKAINFFLYKIVDAKGINYILKKETKKKGGHKALTFQPFTNL